MYLVTEFGHELFYKLRDAQATSPRGLNSCQLFLFQHLKCLCGGHRCYILHSINSTDNPLLPEPDLPVIAVL